MKRGKSAIIAAVGSLMTVVLFVSCPVGRSIEVETVQISSGQLIETVLLRGTVGYLYEEPFVALRDGIVEQVCVQQGQAVNGGDVLVRLDTEAEEQMLAAMYRTRYQTIMQTEGMEAPVQAFLYQRQTEWMSDEAEVKTRIECSTIRARTDGIVDEILVQPGDYIMQASVLGVLREEKKTIMVSAMAQDAARLHLDCAARLTVGNQMYGAKLVGKERTQDGGYMLQFEPLDDTFLASYEAGESMQLEAIADIRYAEALIPLSAFDSEGRLWWTENDRVWCEYAEIESCNRQFAAAGIEWRNRCLILHPENVLLFEGMSVRVNE